jgi:hypothetical protein
MPAQSGPRIFANLSTRLDLETHERRRRLEGACGLSSSRVLQIAYRYFEDGLLDRLSAAERQAYLDGDPSGCRLALSRQLDDANAAATEVNNHACNRPVGHTGDRIDGKGR